MTDPTSQLRHEREGYGEHVDESANGAAEEVEEVVAAALAEDRPDEATAAVDPEGDGVEGALDGADTRPDAASKGFASGLTGMLELGGEAGEFAPLEDGPIGLLAEDERVLLGDGVECLVHPVGVDDGVAQLDLLNPSRLGDKPLLGSRHPMLPGGDLLLFGRGDLRQLATALLGKLLLRFQHPLLLGGPDLRGGQGGLLVDEPLFLGGSKALRGLGLLLPAVDRSKVFLLLLGRHLAEVVADGVDDPSEVLRSLRGVLELLRPPGQDLRVDKATREALLDSGDLAVGDIVDERLERLHVPLRVPRGPMEGTAHLGRVGSDAHIRLADHFTASHGKTPFAWRALFTGYCSTSQPPTTCAWKAAKAAPSASASACVGRRGLSLRRWLGSGLRRASSNAWIASASTSISLACPVAQA